MVEGFIGMETSLLLDVQSVRKTFPRPGGGELVVLEDVNLRIAEGEIVGLLGRSGSGKSTLLRLIAGLSRPAGGRVSYLGRAVEGPPPGIAIVFQSFALFPWLTVLENVEIGLEALGLSQQDIRARALQAIDLIGLDGFKSAYPRELSGGMRQRVGFARALVVHPNVLLMDEPFSALDVLTAETVRTDFLELWSDGKLPIKGVILVTHNIEEAVQMCNRILLFSTNPGRIIAEIAVNLPQPRSRLDPNFRALVEQIYSEMTARKKAPFARIERLPRDRDRYDSSPGVVQPLVWSSGTFGGNPYDGKADLPVLASSLHMEVDDLFPVAESLQMLRFVDIEGGDIRLTDAGSVFVHAETDIRKQLFGDIS